MCSEEEVERCYSKTHRAIWPIVDVDVETTIYANGYIVIDVEKVYIDDEGWLVVKDKDGYEFTFNSWTHDTLLDICCSLI